MAFPFEQNLNRSLRGTDRDVRERAVAYDFGLASIEKGHGSTDLLDGDTVVASYGDLPDGSQGVGVTIDGALVNIATWTRGEVTRIDGELSAHDSRITANKTKNDQQDSTLSSHNTRITAAQARADAAMAKAQEALNAANAAGGTAGSVAQSLASLTASVQNLDNRVVALENKIGTILG